MYSIKRDQSEIKILLFVVLMMFSCGNNMVNKNKPSASHSYFVNTSGNDSKDGTKEYPYRSIEKINSINLHPGDTVLFEGGQIFNGTLNITSNKSGNAGMPVVITSYDKSKASINSLNEKGIVITDADYISLYNLNVTGSGRKDGNTKDGITIKNCKNIFIDSFNISGYQKSGVDIHSSSDVNFSNINSHDNGFAGIAVGGDSSKKDCRHINMSHCNAYNNPGDPTELHNHSGNGIIISQCTNINIEYCTATNNGWDMPRIGNGPVGIWAWDADSVTISHCISYKNKTSKGGEDGGGFDFDGGVTNSTIQYCLSYENDGSGFGLFEFKEAKPWYNNILRYNISVNDGWVSPAKAGIYIWNASLVNKLKDCYIYNNIIYNAAHAAIHYAPISENAGFRFYNNIFVGQDEIIIGNYSGDFLCNDWWNLSSGFNIGGIKDFKQWALTNNSEQINGSIVGLNFDPHFDIPHAMSIDNVELLKTFKNFSAPQQSQLRTKGLNLKDILKIETGDIDFNGNDLNKNGIGASF